MDHNNVIDILPQLLAKGALKMSEELITPENLSNELLKNVFEAAYMDVSEDEDGDICVKEQCKLWFYMNNSKTLIQVSTIFRFEENISDEIKEKAVNEINRNYVIVKATFKDDTLRFQYDFMVNGGITKKALVLGIKRFASIPREAIEDYAKDIVA